MRELTNEEIVNTPYWATHYYIEIGGNPWYCPGAQLCIGKGNVEFVAQPIPVKEVSE